MYEGGCVDTALQPDSVYWERILRWNKQPDKALLLFLEVDPRLFLPDSATHYRDRDKHFLPAIHTLQQIKTTFTPDTKLEVNKKVT